LSSLRQWWPPSVPSTLGSIRLPSTSLVTMYATVLTFPRASKPTSPTHPSLNAFPCLTGFGKQTKKKSCK
jgi:hypothetical protein